MSEEVLENGLGRPQPPEANDLPSSEAAPGDDAAMTVAADAAAAKIAENAAPTAAESAENRPETARPTDAAAPAGEDPEETESDGEAANAAPKAAAVGAAAGTPENAAPGMAEQPGAAQGAEKQAGEKASIFRPENVCCEVPDDGSDDNPRHVRPPKKSWGWGLCIGVCLMSLCLACLLMLSALIAHAGQNNAATLPMPGPGVQEDEQRPVEPGDDSTRLQVYDVPQEENGYTTQYIVNQVQDSVVGILVYDGTGIDPVGAGTGIVMSEDGHIVTNAHVVADATGLTVVLRDETRYTAKVLGYDEKTDLAVIKINAEGLQPAQFGNSDQVVVGERAIAIGNPGGLTGSVSQGIISGKNREIPFTLSDGSTVVLTALQTDAAINPGNSGGPLLNAWGQVIGINSSKIVRTGYEGIGFAIPVNEAQPIIDNLIQYGYVRDRAVLGITVIALDASNGPANGLPSQGLYIASIQDYSDLLNHGIAAGDVILTANGVTLTTLDDLSEQLRQFRPGDTIRMEFLHTYDQSVIEADILLLDSRAGG